MHKQPRTNYSYNPKLVKEDDSISEDISEILEAVTSHYHELLSDSYNSPEQPAMIEYVLEGMQHKISNAAQANLVRPLLEEEVAVLWQVFVERPAQAPMGYQEIFSKHFGT